MRVRGGYIRGNISTAKVWSAADYLQSTPLYRTHEITVSTAWMEQINSSIADEDEDMSDADDSASNAEDSTTNQQDPAEELEDHLATFTGETYIASDEQLRLAPGEGKTPLSILRDEDIDYLAFPKIFYGHKLATTASYAD
ncbi:hypothetical protein, partial, partial [Parasitella parasitica]